MFQITNQVQLQLLEIVKFRVQTCLKLEQNQQIAYIDPSFTSHLSQLLESSRKPIKSLQEQSIKQIRECQQICGYASAMLQISQDKSQSEFIQLSAAIQFQHYVKSAWNPSSYGRKVTKDGYEAPSIEEVDKSIVKDYLIKCIYEQENHLITKQYLTALETILKHEYPRKWPGIVEKILEFLQNEEDKTQVLGLQLLYSLGKGLSKCPNLEWKTKLGHNNTIVSQTFNYVGQIVDRKMNLNNQKSQEIVYLILKIFERFNIPELCEYFKNVQFLDPWMSLFKQILDKQIDPELLKSTDLTDEIIDKENHIEWKQKSKCARITYLIFYKYQSSHFLNRDQESMSITLKQRFLNGILESHLKLIFSKPHNFVATESLVNACRLFQLAISNKELIESLRLPIEQFLTQVVIQSCKITEKDLLELQEDQSEYIRKQELKDNEEIIDQKLTMTSLLEYICSFKIKQPKENGQKQKAQPVPMQGDFYFKKFFEFCIENLNQYQALQSQDWKLKESILYLIQKLSRHFTDIKNRDIITQDHIDQFIGQHVLPELQSPHVLMKISAIRLIGNFYRFSYKTEEMQVIIFEGYIQSIQDQNNLVRYYAAANLPLLLNHKIIFNLTKIKLSLVLKEYLKLLTELEEEEIIKALKLFLDVYQNDITAEAWDIIFELINCFQNCYKPEDQILCLNDVNFRRKENVAIQCLSSINTILGSISENQELLKRIERVLSSTIQKIFQNYENTSQDISLEMCKILLLLVNQSQDKISDLLWSNYPIIINLIIGKCKLQPLQVKVINEENSDSEEDRNQYSNVGIAYDEKDIFNSIIQGYIKIDPQTLLKKRVNPEQTYFDITIEYIQIVMQLETKLQLRNLDEVRVTKTLILLIEQLKGQINDFIPDIIMLSIHYLKSDQINQEFKNALLLVVCMCLWYDTPLTLQCLLHIGQLSNFILSIGQNLDKIQHIYDTRMILFGLICMLKNPISQMNVFDILSLTIKVSQKIYSDRSTTMNKQNKKVDKKILDFSQGNFNLDSDDEEESVHQDFMNDDENDREVSAFEDQLIQNVQDTANLESKNNQKVKKSKKNHKTSVSPQKLQLYKEFLASQNFLTTEFGKKILEEEEEQNSIELEQDENLSTQIQAIMMNSLY
eukprot:403377381